MSKQDDFRAALVAGDVRLLRRMWSSWFPHLPQVKNAHEAEIVMHHARTQAESIPLKHRAYSHRWLLERELPSGLPDQLRPSAERMYPVAAKAVGISVNMRSPYMAPAVVEVRGSMEHAVLEAEADGLLGDTTHVSRRMTEAKNRTMRALFGR
jgi:hypothetical protein